jgi:hypothetical protein
MDMVNKEFHALLGALLDNGDLFNRLSAPGISTADLKQRAMQFRQFQYVFFLLVRFSSGNAHINNNKFI